jgi:hypothetical protein
MNTITEIAPAKLLDDMVYLKMFSKQLSIPKNG